MTRLVFLGSGTSYGVPMIGCDCAVCRSDDPRNNRTRASVLVCIGEQTILIDSSIDLRVQALRHNLKYIDALLYTHSHADHLHGIDDVRSFSRIRRGVIPTYGDAHTLGFIRKNYAYIFNDPHMRLGWGIPRMELHVIEKPVSICGADVTPIPILHGERTILGYRVDRLAYLTDCSGIPEASRALLKDLDTLVLDGLRHEPHPTHFSIPQALATIEELRPRRAWLTHLTHDVDHAVVEATLPDNVRLAYDGLEINIRS